MSLTICLLTRNAEPHISDALRSVADLGAEVLVGDTGSTDCTVESARALGAKVSELAWHDDFAAAQNNLLDQAKGEWILWLNPDESVLPYPHGRLDGLLAQPNVLAYAVRIHVMARADVPEQVAETLNPRLFRNHPALRFRGRIHPHFPESLDVVARRENRQLALTDLVIRKHAYHSTLTAGKLRWATRLLELELRDRPGQLHYLIEYGQNLLRLNSPQGHAVLAEAAEQVLAAADAPVAPSPTVASLLEYRLTVSSEQCRSRLSLEQARTLVLRWFPKSPPLYWALAQRSFQAGDFHDAAALLRHVVELGRTGTYDRSAAFDPSIMDGPALLNLGQCYLRLGDLDRAAACFNQLLGHPKHGVKAAAGLGLVEQARQRPPMR
jgi:hypothetical protein